MIIRRQKLTWLPARTVAELGACVIYCDPGIIFEHIFGFGYLGDAVGMINAYLNQNPCILIQRISIGAIRRPSVRDREVIEFNSPTTYLNFFCNSGEGAGPVLYCLLEATLFGHKLTIIPSSFANHTDMRVRRCHVVER